MAAGQSRLLHGKRLIIFDMDGTLIDSVGMWNETDGALIRQLGGDDGDGPEIGLRRDALLRRFRAEPNPYAAYCRWIGEYCGSPLSVEDILTARDRIAREKLVHEIRYKEGAPEMIRFLHGAGRTLVIATTTRRKNMDVYRLENENIRSAAKIDDYFAAVYTREDVAVVKPSPEVHEKILAHFHARREECLIFEDSLTGVMAARAAGIDAAAMYDVYSKADQEEIRRRSAWHFQNWKEALAAAKS